MHYLGKMTLIALLSLSGISMAAEKLAAPAFTPEQEARIGEVSKGYLLAHPEVLLEVSQKLQALQQEKRVQDMTAAVIHNQTALLMDGGSPSVGSKTAKVTIVEFFDYQCIYCARLAPEVERAIKANPDVRFVFKEWPIFGQRWEASSQAARVGLQIWQQKGADAYLVYHNALFSTGHNEGKLTVGDISEAAKAAAFDWTKAADVQGTLEETNGLAQLLGFTGTPALVVMPSTGADMQNVIVIPGMAGAEVLQVAIEKAGKSSAH
ncbi:Protein-disulfide isomerase [Serratia proteamaculans]|uniref:DsbA family protein n=1 Tax=Serratia proteamaculans TaxID=28151 RepID=UPI0021829CAA|nr:Protein-disulfide isomerase [Serratia proteamaculans]